MLIVMKLPILYIILWEYQPFYGVNYKQYSSVSTTVVKQRRHHTSSELFHPAYQENTCDFESYNITSFNICSFVK